MKDPHEVLGGLEQVRSETLRRLADLTQDQLDRRPPPADGEEERSLGEIFMHLAIRVWWARSVSSPADRSPDHTVA